VRTNCECGKKRAHKGPSEETMRLFWSKRKRKSRLIFIYILAIVIILLIGYLIAQYTDAFRSYSPSYYEPKDLERDDRLRQKE